jgi:hypothetical protein
MVMPTLLDWKGSMSGSTKPKKWIKSAVSNKGALHRHLNVPEGEKIPEEKLRAALHSKNPTIRKEAALAATLKGFKKHSEPKKKTASERMSKMYKGK